MKLKSVSKVISALGKGIDEYGPQIMAIGSAACFVAGIIFAAKESPEAFEALEEKLEDNPDMNKVEQFATVVSRMPKTVAATLSGLTMHIFAWKKILGKLATVTGALALAKQENIDVLEAAKEVVGPDKAKEIVRTKDQMVSYRDSGVWEPDEVDKREVMYPFTIMPFCITVWKTLDEFEKAHVDSVNMLARNEELSGYDYFLNLKSDEKPTLDCGWRCDSCVGTTGADQLKWAQDELSYQSKVQMYKGKYPGYLIEFNNQPTEAVENC